MVGRIRLTPAEEVVIECIRRHPSGIQGVDILKECPELGDEVRNYTRRLHAAGIIMRKTSGKKYANVWVLK